MNDDREASGLDETVVVQTPPSSSTISSHRYGRESSHLDRARGDANGARSRKVHQLNVLVFSALPRLQRVVEELRVGQGVSSYTLTSVSEHSKWTNLLHGSSWDGYVFDESTISSLDPFPESDRLRILRSSVVVTELGAPGLASMSAAESVPLDRCSRFSLDNTLSRIARRKIAGGRPKDRETLPDILWGIARRNLQSSTDLATAFRPLVETAARLLKLGRASVWRFLDNPKRLRCEAMFVAATGDFISGIEVPASMCPGYCAALESHRILSIQDAMTDARCSELVPIYLRDAGIGALLDAPIYLDGEVVGLFCCAHVGGMRSWTEAEQYFAASMSDFSQLILMANQHHRSIEIVRAQRTRMLRGQPLEIMGAMADAASGQIKSIFSGLYGGLQRILRESASDLSPDTHTQLLALLSSCEKGNQLTAQIQSFSPRATRTTVDGSSCSALESVEAAADMIRGVAPPGVTLEGQFERACGSVPCSDAALTSALFNLGYQAISHAPNGAQLKMSALVRTANGRSREVFEFSISVPRLIPVDEAEAGLVVVSNFAADVSGTLTVKHVQEMTVIALRVPLVDTSPHTRPRGHGTIMIVADVEEPRELVDVLRFFKYSPMVLSTQESIDYLRQQQSSVKLILMDASNSDVPVQERLRPLRLSTTRPIVVIGSEEDCSGVSTSGVRLTVLPGASLAAIASYVEQALQRSWHA